MVNSSVSSPSLREVFFVLKRQGAFPRAYLLYSCTRFHARPSYFFGVSTCHNLDTAHEAGNGILSSMFHVPCVLLLSKAHPWTTQFYLTAVHIDRNPEVCRSQRGLKGGVTTQHNNNNSSSSNTQQHTLKVISRTFLLQHSQHRTILSNKGTAVFTYPSAICLIHLLCSYESA